VPVSEPRQKLKVLFFLTVASFVLGLLCFFPYLEEEHRRMDPSMRILVWGSDGIGLIWFTWYFTKHYRLGEPFRHGMGESPRLTREWWLALVSLTASLAFDLAVTSMLEKDERAGLARAVVVKGAIHSVERTSGSKFHSYTIRCRFQDGHGAWHEGRFPLNEHRGTHQFKDALPVEVQQALRDGRVPCPIPLAYDPVLPGRNWIAGIDPGEGYRFHALSWCIRLFQGIAILNFVVFLRQAIQTHSRLPWWYDLHMVLPFLVGSAFLGFFGSLIRVTGFVVQLVFN
jgi:hypothetical protein